MKIIETDTMYSYVLTEDEWYSATQDRHSEFVTACKGAALDRGKKYASIFVDPNPVMSIAPTDIRHRVWSWSAPVPEDHRFQVALSELLHDCKLPHKRIKAILQSYADSY